MISSNKLTPLRIVKEKEQLVGERPVAKINPYPGHTLFKFAPSGKLSEVTEEDYEQTDYDLSGGNSRKLVQEKGCLYLSALNIKNATRKLRKMGVVK